MSDQRLVRGSAGYPAQLAMAPDAPDALFCRGDIALLSCTAVAIVGARQATQLGIAMARSLGTELARARVVVVSGCAIGIDAEAHAGALAVAGPTVAVLGGGIDVAAPASNRALATRIGRQGCVVTEYAPGTTPRRHHFPARNRIIAGLARIVVVVEAGERSGALITARHALSAGREVMAVPTHPLVQTSIGANQLIADGARPVFSGADILHELAALPRMEGVEPVSPVSTPGRAQGSDGISKPRVSGVLAALSDRPATPEEIADRLGADLPRVLSDLVQLEIIGLARALPGSRYTKGSQHVEPGATP